MSNTQKRKRYINDIILAVLLLVLALSVFLILEFTKEAGSLARVSVNGEIIADFPLDKDGEYSLSDGKNTLVIKDGEAFISEADCPDKVCVRTGKISKVGEQIICLPNRVIVEIVGRGEEIIPIN